MYKKNKLLVLLLSMILLVYSLSPFSISYANSNNVTVEKTVNPDSIFVDEEAEITLSVKGTPPVNFIVPNDVILIIDKSGSMSPNHKPNNGEDKIANARDAAKGFIDLMDMSKHRVGVVDFSSPEITNSFELTTDAESAKAYIDGINANGSTATGDAIYTAMQLLSAKRDEAQPVIVLLTDGEATIPKDGPTSAFEYAKEAASAAKDESIVFYTIALLNVGENPDASAPNLLLKEMATTAQHHHFVLGSIGLAEIYNKIVQEIGKASAYNVILTDIVASEFEIVPDSYKDNIPQPRVEGNKLIWEFQELKEEELTFKYKVRHKDGERVGELPISTGSNITYLDYEDKRINDDVPSKLITVKHYAPNITNLSQDSCDIKGEEVITIFGEYFREGLTVKFGDIDATVEEAIDSTQVKVMVPTGKQGDTTITLTNDDGQKDTAQFKYTAQPVVNKIEPSSGFVSGDTRVQIDGQYFMENIQVKFGESIASNVVVSNNGTTIFANTPAASAAGAVNVELTNQDETNISVENGFTYKLPPAPEIELINPMEGKVTGNEIVYIEGANFTPTSEVYFGEKKGGGYYYHDETKIRVITPSVDEAGAVDVKVVNPDGQYETVEKGFTYIETEPPNTVEPKIISVTPNEGVVGGNEIVQIEGENFELGSEVYFGDKKAGGYYRYDDKKIRVTTPAADVAGAVDVKVVNPGGKYAVLSGGFTYTETEPPNSVEPKIISVTPNEGVVGGNEIVQIEGENFELGSEVYFGDKKAGGYYRYDDKKIRVTTPAADVAGAVDVKVVNPGGKYAVLSGGFTYTETEPPNSVEPEIISVTPNEGVVGGNEIVYVEGNNFELGSEVYFGDKKAGGYYRYSDKKIRVTTPAADAAGEVDVKVVNPGGKYAALSGGFTYTETEPPNSVEPEIISVTPNEGVVGGNEIVYVEGNNFELGSEVYFGDKKAGAYYRYSDKKIRVATPAADAAGAVDVKVVNPGGKYSTLSGGFTYMESEPPNTVEPVINSITPNEGELKGNYAIYIEGSNFEPGGEVYFGDKKATGYYRYSDIKIRVLSPVADTAGAVNVRVVNPGGESVTVENGFTYIEPPALPEPEITLISPNEGKMTGNEIVYIEGANFTPGGEVYFGDKKAGGYYRYSDNRIRAIIPAVDTAGIVDVKVVNSDGQFAIMANGFTYTEPPAPPAPEIISVSPAEGKLAGGQAIYIEGANFSSGGEVYFGEKKASGYYRYSDNRIRAISPLADEVGTVDIRVVNQDGQSTTLTGGFTYNAVVPSITSVSISEGEMSGNEIMFIYGENFEANAKVYFGSTETSSVYRYSDKKIRVITPKADAPGTVDITIENPDGSSNTLSSAFTYKEPPEAPAPIITSVTPKEGAKSGNTIVFIYGENFEIDTKVYFGSEEATGFYRYNDGKIRVLSPAADVAGTVDIKVENVGDKSVILVDGFTYTD
ncbi:IPT/TIG domain-containing protein [Wukongibacter sp. M2B1]|uniref:IPT/TIG domain-containing protein n=1 Tax=Wukongibacter sp. M2B1 TaxID=3088895 RepID=UPI003D7BAC45